MNETVTAPFLKEEIARRVKVPTIVEQDLKRIISDRLEQCGIYYRCFSRIKTAASMERKFSQKQYDETRKLQDLVGVRINLYFDDDVEIVKDMMENIFDIVEWSASERSEDEFKPTKLNGVFRMPKYLRAMISADTWDMFIDDTFEIQIKTIFFEGWHEIEHDMRYKGEELWNDYSSFSRYLNSILATLELCDKSMVTLFEELGHELYKSGRWNDMIKSHFRVKLGDALLYPEVDAFLTEDYESGENIAKKLYKTDKRVLIDLLQRRSRKIPINVNTIIAVLNDGKFHNARLAELMRKRDVYNDGREDSTTESGQYELKPMVRQTIFQMVTQVDGSRLKEETVTPELIFEKAAASIYRWIVQKYGVLFRDMPQELTTWHADILAYHVIVNYNPDKGRMNMHVRHMDPEIGGRTWYSEASLEIRREGRVYLRVNNGYAEPMRESLTGKDSGLFFSYPGYYKAIVDNIGIDNGLPCSNRRRILKEDQMDELKAAIERPDCLFPVVLIVSPEDQEGQMDESWLDQFRVSDFTRTVWRYTHVFTAYEKTGRKMLNLLGQDGNRPDAVPGLYIFWPDGDVDRYGPEDVENCGFGRHFESRTDTRTYDYVRGGQAFYHKIVTDLRDWIVTSKIWDGFKLEIMTEIPD